MKRSKNTRRYDLHKKGTDRLGSWLATVIITDDGYFSTVSEYGNYAYWWGSIGPDDFREFLCGLDDDYLISKIAPGRVYDSEETEKAIRKHILEERRALRLTRELAAEEWQRLRDADLNDDLGFYLWHQDTKFEYAHEWAHMTMRRPDAKWFAKRVWPVLCEALKAEMAAEKVSASAQV